MIERLISTVRSALHPLWVVGALVLAAGLLTTATAAAAVNPPSVTAELNPGESVVTDKTVDVPEVPPNSISS